MRTKNPASVPIEWDQGSEGVRIRVSLKTYEFLKECNVVRSIDEAARLLCELIGALERGVLEKDSSSEIGAARSAFVGLDDLKQPLAECARACAHLRASTANGEIFRNPAVLLDELVDILKEALPSVVGLPCLCANPELHDDLCVRLRVIVLRAGLLSERPTVVEKGSNPLTETFTVRQVDTDLVSRKDSRTEAEELFLRLDRIHAAVDAVDEIESTIRRLTRDAAQAR